MRWLFFFICLLKFSHLFINLYVTYSFVEMLKKSRRSVIYEDGEQKKFDLCVLSELVGIVEVSYILCPK